MSSVAKPILRQLTPKTTALFLCDMQDKFAANIQHFDDIVSTSARLLKAATILGLPVVATEQYPKGLGRTVPTLELVKHNVPIFEKTCFSMVSDKVMESIGPEVETVALCGIEAHACIFQTALQLLDRGLTVHVIPDAVSSRSPVERKFALRSLERAGAWLTPSECLLLALLKDAAHPNFKAVQKLIMDTSPETDLMRF